MITKITIKWGTGIKNPIFQFLHICVKILPFYHHNLSQNSITLQMISQNISIFLPVTAVSLHISLDLRVLKFSSVIKM